MSLFRTLLPMIAVGNVIQEPKRPTRAFFNSR